MRSLNAGICNNLPKGACPGTTQLAPPQVAMDPPRARAYEPRILRSLALLQRAVVSLSCRLISVSGTHPARHLRMLLQNWPPHSTPPSTPRPRLQTPQTALTGSFASDVGLQPLCGCAEERSTIYRAIRNTASAAGQRTGRYELITAAVTSILIRAIARTDSAPGTLAPAHIEKRHDAIVTMATSTPRYRHCACERTFSLQRRSFISECVALRALSRGARRLSQVRTESPPAFTLDLLYRACPVCEGSKGAETKLAVCSVTFLSLCGTAVACAAPLGSTAPTG